MRKRVVKIAVAAGVGVASLTGVLASPAWAPRVHTIPAGLTVDKCKNEPGWAFYGYRNQGQCVSAAAQNGAK